jgi:hypothetical protein
MVSATVEAAVGLGDGSICLLFECSALPFAFETVGGTMLTEALPVSPCFDDAWSFKSNLCDFERSLRVCSDSQGVPGSFSRVFSSFGGYSAAMSECAIELHGIQKVVSVGGAHIPGDRER